MTGFEAWVRARGQPIVELARELNVSRVSVYRLMAGAVIPRPERVRDIERLSAGAVTAATLHNDFRGKRDVSVE